MVGIFTSCIDKNARKNNYPATIVVEDPVGTVYTVGGLLDVWRHAGSPDNYRNDTIFNDYTSLYGIITYNDYKTSFIQDRAEGEAIELFMQGVTGLRIGDSVRVCLKGAVLGSYYGTPQIQNLDPVKVVVLANGKYIEPQVVTIADIKLKKHLCQLVKLEDVQFIAADTTKNWADADDTGERTLSQCGTNNTVMVRTSKFVAFADKPLPTGNGFLTAIVTVYIKKETVWQLLVRDVTETEILMNGERCPE